jgi:uncharacterized phage infection (PIP) family protein YhgE
MDVEDVEIENFAHEDALVLAALSDARAALTRSDVADRINLPDFDKSKAAYRLNKLSSRGLVSKENPDDHNAGIQHSLSLLGETYGAAAARYTDYESPVEIDREQLLGSLQQTNMKLEALEQQVQELQRTLDEVSGESEETLSGVEDRLDDLEIQMRKLGSETNVRLRVKECRMCEKGYIPESNLQAKINYHHCPECVEENPEIPYDTVGCDGCGVKIRRHRSERFQDQGRRGIVESSVYCEQCQKII